MIKWSRNNTPQSALGLRLGAGRLQVVHAARDKGAIAVQGVLDTELSLDLFQAEPELVARELRNHLDSAKLTEKNVVVALPAAWAMSVQSRLPGDLSPEDEAGLLAIDAEKGFPTDPEQLQIASSRLNVDGQRLVTQLGLRKETVARVTQVLQLAGLRVRSLSLGLPSLVDEPAKANGLLVLLDPAQPSLLIQAAGGIARLRPLDLLIESQGEQVLADGALLREVRITHEQTPEELRRKLSFLRLCGQPALVEAAERSLTRWATSQGLTLETNQNTETSAGLAMATRVVSNFLLSIPAPGLEFLPPRENRFKALLHRYNSKRITTIGIAAGALLAVLLVSFGWLEIRAWYLRSKWDSIRTDVGRLESTQNNIREFRSWHDNSCISLSIVKLVADAFPDNGSVTAKTLEVRGASLISVTGTMRDNTALLKALDQLSHNQYVRDLKVDQIRGKSPAQFTFTFHYTGGYGQ